MMAVNPAMVAFLENYPMAGRTCRIRYRSTCWNPDVSAAIAYLVSDDAKYVTGVTFPVDAGFCNKLWDVMAARGRVAGKRVVVTGAARGWVEATPGWPKGADLVLVDICGIPAGGRLSTPRRGRTRRDRPPGRGTRGRRAVTHVVDIRDAAALAAAVADGVE